MNKLVLSRYPYWKQYFEHLTNKGWNEESIEKERIYLEKRILNPPTGWSGKLAMGIVTLPLGPVGLLLTGLYSYEETQYNKIISDAYQRYENFCNTFDQSPNKGFEKD